MDKLPEKTKVREKLVRASLILASLVVGFIIMELLVYQLELAPEVLVLQMNRPHGFEGRFRLSENPTLIYEPVPLSGEINEFGFRGSPPTPEDLGKRRIVFVGDSQTYGVAFPHQQTFTKLLEDKFNANNLPLRIFNIAVPGYNLKQEFERVQTAGLSLKPDHVVFGLNVTDLKVSSGEIKYFLDLLKDQHGILPSEVNETLRTPLLHTLLRSNIFRILVFGMREDSNPFRSFKKLPEEIHQTELENILGQLEVLARSHRFTYSFVLLPNPDLDRWNFYENLREIFERRKLRVWNLHKEFNSKLGNQSEKTWHYFLPRDQYHFNLQGHELIANMFFEDRAKWLSEFSN